MEALRASRATTTRAAAQALVLALLALIASAAMLPTPALAALGTAGLAPEQLYELSMAPACDYEAGVKIWNPSTAGVWVDVARMDGITVYSLVASGHRASVAVGGGMRVLYRLPLGTDTATAPPAKSATSAASATPAASATSTTADADTSLRMQALKSLAEPLGYDLALLSQNYTFFTAKGTPIAGRETTQIRVMPKWPGNMRRTVWADRDTGAALRIEDRNYRGDLIWLWEVVRISFMTPSRRSLEAARAALSSQDAVPCTEQSLPLAEVSGRIGFRVGLPAWVPEGYRLVAVRPSRTPGGPKGPRQMALASSPVAQLIYSDGLGTITLYQRRVPWWARRVHAPRLGYPIEWERGGIRYVLVGDVDPELLLKMARSL